MVSEARPGHRSSRRWRSPPPPPPSRSRSRPPADPLEDVPFLVTATGIGIEDYNVYATIKPVGAVGCGPTFETDADGESFMYGEDAEGAYSVADSAKVANPGPYLVCAWLQKYSGDSVAVAATSMTVNVRSARATLAVTGPTATADREHGELHLHRHHRDRP